ncbi:Flp family type IVb pilin [Vibrio owensii]|uniref:Pilus assembly protein n=1 Tax=Vibrio owensii CAIM 1854 = LMG 25443 TaxID=1229493 RepID=A0A0C1ZFY4_9VIBR|nr:Flp family type IVb pilin [Vibrio owensii]KIF54894.1 pilus assembly protein [Vibrio owensii CAIM 1854 = LMG 25443]CAH1595647.1 Pilus assembly protein [Vibrio owensii]CAH1600291.1 Pilus assembly protein [Vibrio owensii]
MITKLYVDVTNYLNELKNDEQGVTAIEYGLIGVAMAAFLILTFASDGSLITALDGAFDDIAADLDAF